MESEIPETVTCPFVFDFCCTVVIDNVPWALDGAMALRVCVCVYVCVFTRVVACFSVALVVLLFVGFALCPGTLDAL